jgi:hypothetical protein
MFMHTCVHLGTRARRSREDGCVNIGRKYQEAQSSPDTTSITDKSGGAVLYQPAEAAGRALCTGKRVATAAWALGVRTAKRTAKLIRWHLSGLALSQLCLSTIVKHVQPGTKQQHGDDVRLRAPEVPTVRDAPAGKQRA